MRSHFPKLQEKIIQIENEILNPNYIQMENGLRAKSQSEWQMETS